MYISVVLYNWQFITIFGGVGGQRNCIVVIDIISRIALSLRTVYAVKNYIFVNKEKKEWYCSQCIFSVLLRWSNAIKVWAIKMPDKHKYEYKWISASYRMIKWVIEILILSTIILNFLFMFVDFENQVCDFYKHYVY